MRRTHCPTHESGAMPEERMRLEQGISRRELIGGAAAAGAAATLLGPGQALARTPKRKAKPTVAVLGGGMAGLAAAHELVERGFTVHVFERKALGGKARSIPGAGARA